MTDKEKQEEIREGMVYQLVEQAENNLLHNLGLMTRSGEERDYLCGVADIILSYLHSQGVVIKVKRELPDNEAWHKVEREFEAYCAGKNDLVNAGYEATIPIKE